LKAKRPYHEGWICELEARSTSFLSTYRWKK